MTQGGPASPTLFNIFIDTLANDLQKHLPTCECQLPANFYADDVILHVNHRLDLRRSLILREKWARKYEMRWSLSNGKSETLFPSQLTSQFKQFAFAEGRITSISKAVYLRVIVLQMEYWNAAYKTEFRWHMLHSAHCGMQNFSFQVWTEIRTNGVINPYPEQN